MKRFVLVLALVAVAGATYVATAPGSQTASPTMRQFNALKAQVAALKTKLNTVKSVVVLDTKVLTDCMAISFPIKQFGDGQHSPATFGYTYTPSAGGDPVYGTALDATQLNDPDAFWITAGSATCGTDINGAALRKAARLAGIRLHATAPRVFRAGSH